MVTTRDPEGQKKAGIDFDSVPRFSGRGAAQRQFAVITLPEDPSIDFVCEAGALHPHTQIIEIIAHPTAHPKVSVFIRMRSMLSYGR